MGSSPRRQVTVIGWLRMPTAALVGALCWAGWFASLEPASRFLWRDCDVDCQIGLILLFVPAMAIVSAIVGWGLLRTARFSPAWPTAVLGPVCAVVLVVAYLSGPESLQVQLPRDGGIYVCGIAAAAGYALAAEVTARYGGRRDRTEHSGQDG